MAGKRILIVDDEERITQTVAGYLRSEGFAVVTAGDGDAGLRQLEQQVFDLMVLDLMMPGRDGWSVTREVRKHSRLPIILLTARAEETDKLLGLELGADDYVTKPFSVRELAARIRAVLRRTGGGEDDKETASYGPLTIHFANSEAKLAGRPLPLTVTEFKLMAALARRPGRVFSRAQLLEVAMGSYYEGYERSIDTHISNLRKKIENDPANPRFIITVHGLGYRFARE